MSKNILSIFIMTIFFVSCDIKDEFEQENSNAVDFAGEWNYAVYSADMNTELKIYNRYRLFTYNSSANLANEIWIHTEDQPLSIFSKLKFKSNFTGNLASFSSPSAENIKFMTQPASSPDSVGATAELVQYKNCSVQNGKIIKGAGVSKSGNPTDSIYLQINAVQNTSSFIGISSGSSVIWQGQSNVDANVQLVIAGQRATGFVEDIW